MKTLIVIATVLLAVPAFAADPGQPVYSVWAYKLTDNQWVKSNQYSWTTTDPRAASDYARKVNAVASWCATTNLPVSPSRPVQGYPNYRRGPLQIVDNGVQATISLGPMTVVVPSRMIPRDADGQLIESPSDNDWSSTYSDTSDIDNMIRTQDMINTQLQYDRIQDMINAQSFLNTENMINTQNMVDQMNAQAAQAIANPCARSEIEGH
jgi:hypothetical protein